MRSLFTNLTFGILEIQVVRHIARATVEPAGENLQDLGLGVEEVSHICIFVPSTPRNGNEVDLSNASILYYLIETIISHRHESITEGGIT